MDQYPKHRNRYTTAVDCRLLSWAFRRRSRLLSLYVVADISTRILMERGIKSGSQGNQDDSHDRVPSTSGDMRIPSVPVEPLNHGQRSHVTTSISEVATPSPAEYQNLFRRALQEPNSLSMDDVQVLAASICQSAIRKVNYATPAAEFCVAIIEQEWGEVFLEYVLMFCRELFNSRDEVLRPPDQPTIRSRRWVAYVSFLAELLDGLSDAQAENTARPCRTGGAYATKARRMLVLATLICVSCQTMLQPPSLYNPTEMECLRTALITAGAALEHEAPERLAAVMREVQAALETQRLPIRSRQVLQELMELKASAWQQTPSEQTYVSTATSR
ncbi:uncharacterized protein LOC119398914 [Rhipicephalus sanguineus]|uniref:uncharacterized protein LOC119398914 n=1 Tax=Rhipicephalus sanguineus TaxID=34632 RepID=UPI0020C56020|nr:uncharacterized protein LOC119398914 [Rhipicephalus sanguineus]